MIQTTAKCLLGIILLKRAKKIRGRNNIVSCRSNHIINSRIYVYGNNNVIEIHENCRVDNTKIYIRGDNCKVIINSGCFINNGDICIEDNNNQIIIGANTCFTSRFHFACMEGTAISIGERCLFASDIIVRTGDSHSIVEMDSGIRTNYSCDCIVGNHCWIGNRTTINKGVLISDDSIVASNSVVTKQFKEKNVVIAGIPAKVIKRGITWEGERIQNE